jgi:hypothetical protein
MAAEGVPEGAGNIPTAAAAAHCAGSTGVLTFDTQQQLRSCCWLQQQQHNGSTPGSSSDGVLITSGPGGLCKWVIAEVRSSARFIDLRSC